MKPIDALKLGPRRELTYNKETKKYTLTVTPLYLTGLPASSISLTPDQAIRYQEWKAGGGLIQDALPDLTPAEREVIITGISDL